MRRARIVICVALAASACGREASPVAPSPAFTPVTPPFAATYSGQLRIDTCQGCYRSSLGDVRPFVLRLAENAGGGFGGTLSFDYGASSKLIQVAGNRDTGGAFQLTGGFTPASPLDPGTPFELRSLLVREESDGRLSGQGEYVAGTPSATYQISIVSGAHTSNGTAQAGIDGTWIGQALVLECTGDPRYVCDSTMDVGELRYIRFDFTSAGGAVDAGWVDPPAVRATVPIRGTFAGKALTLGGDFEVIEYYRGDHAPPTMELARVHFTLATFTATIDDFNRLQGKIRYSLERTRTFPNASFGRVESGSITLELVDVVPAVK